jgi:hypothetical protein
MLEQRLDQVRAAVHLKLGASSSLSARTPSGTSPSISLEFSHSRLFQGRRGHVLGRLVERLGTGIVAIRPEGREDLVGLAAEDEIEGL